MVRRNPLWPWAVLAILVHAGLAALWFSATPPRPVPRTTISLSATPMPAPASRPPVPPPSPRPAPVAPAPQASPEAEPEPGTPLPAPEAATTAEAVQEAQAPSPGREETAGFDRPQTGALTLPPRVPTAELLSRIRYPERARKAGIEATVVLDLLIDETGAIGSITVISDPGYGLAAEAVRALQGLRCEPATVDGRPTAVRLRYPVRFALK